MKKKSIYFIFPVLFVSFLIGCNPKNSNPTATLTTDKTEVTVKQNQDIRLSYKTSNNKKPSVSSTNNNIAQPYTINDYCVYNNYIFIGTLNLNPGTCYINVSAENTNTVKVKVTVEEDNDPYVVDKTLGIQEAACEIDNAIVNKKANVFIKKVSGISKAEDMIKYLELVDGSAYVTGYGTSDEYFGYAFSYFDNATQSHENSKDYKNLLNANFKIRNDARVKSSRTSLPIDSAPLYPLKLTNSEQLWWVVEHGYRPQFASTSSNVYKCYDAARNICLKYIDDSMSDIEKYKVIFEYLTGGIENYDMQYNYWISDEMNDNDDWTKYTDFYIEGPLLNNSGVCDGFSKTYTLLCGIEQLNTRDKSKAVRSFGYTDGGVGHAWNYCAVDNNYYLTCPTWGRQVKNENSFNFAFTDYSAFLTGKEYFKKVSSSELDFTDYPWSDINKSSSVYSNTGYYPADYYVDTADKTLIQNKLPITKLNQIDKSYAFSFNCLSSNVKNIVNAVGSLLSASSGYKCNDEFNTYCFATIIVLK